MQKPKYSIWQQQTAGSSDESGSVTSPILVQNTPQTPVSTYFQSPVLESKGQRSQYPQIPGTVDNDPPFASETDDGPFSSSFASSQGLDTADFAFRHGATTQNVVDQPWLPDSPPTESRLHGPHGLPAPLPHEQTIHTVHGFLTHHEEATDLDEIEEVERSFPADTDNRLVHARSPTLSSSGSDSSTAVNSSFLFCQPKLDNHSPEGLIRYFVKNTCGILSVKNGWNENPWLTMVWPLATGNPALYHAIASMSAFHASKTQKGMTIRGLTHLNESTGILRSKLHTMPIEAVLATSLALAFADSWEVHVSSGMKYLSGGRFFVTEALMKIQREQIPAPDVARIKFLCNTWLYMDVLARLTTSTNIEEQIEIDEDLWSQIDPAGNREDIDPLMGCASTLFPIIGQVANLVRLVRKAKNSACNSLGIVSTAIELKGKLEKWAPPGHLNRPEDPDCEITHSIQTAEAYRWATLLYLHQAVPEIPSRCCAQLAYLALIHLAAVPVTSTTVIVHIYPLLAAGCEASSEEDRIWIRDRWNTMSQRMQIGNVDKCLMVVEEVWNRRDRAREQRNTCVPGQSDVKLLPAIENFTMPDSFDTNQNWGLCSGRIKQEHAHVLQDVPVVGGPSGLVAMDIRNHSVVTSSNWPPLSGPDSIQHPVASWRNHSRRDSAESIESIGLERTVRGQQHWVGVMEQWEWEGMPPVFSSAELGNVLTHELVLLG